MADTLSDGFANAGTSLTSHFDIERIYNQLRALLRALDGTDTTDLTINGDVELAGANTLSGATTVSGALTTTGGVTNDVLQSAEHGAGVIGTGVAPATYRRTENGIIITTIKIDLTGLDSIATANDVIGLTGAGSAPSYIGQNVVATNGIIFKTEFSCLETPAGGDNDVNVVTNVSGTLEADSAGGTTYISNSGDLVAGQTIQNLVPAITANHYYYLTAGTGDTADTYTAGQYILRTWGHALLT